MERPGNPDHGSTDVVVASAAEFIERKEAQIPRSLKTKDIGRRGKHEWIIEAGTYIQQSNLPEKVLALERLRLIRRPEHAAYAVGAQPGDVEYRFGYHTVARTGKAAGRWWWGQFSQMIPARDLRRLLEEATANGTLLESDLPFRS